MTDPIRWVRFDIKLCNEKGHENLQGEKAEEEIKSTALLQHHNLLFTTFHQSGMTARSLHCITILDGSFIKRRMKLKVSFYSILSPLSLSLRQRAN